MFVVKKYLFSFGKCFEFTDNSVDKFMKFKKDLF